MKIRNKLMLGCYSKGYRIDDQGNVINPKGKQIKCFVDGKNGKPYLCFSFKDIRIKNYAKKVLVHRLQAYQKYGDKIFEEGIVVRHLDSNSFNNKKDNIVIGNQKENNLDKPKNVSSRAALIATRKNQNDIRSEDERSIIYLKLYKGLTYKEIMSQHDVPKGTLSYMKNKSIEYKEYITAHVVERIDTSLQN